MTDRIDALTVVLERDTRDDDVEALVNAIKQMRNVADVALNVADVTSYSARARVQSELGPAFFQVLHMLLYGDGRDELIKFLKSYESK